MAMSAWTRTSYGFHTRQHDYMPCLPMHRISSLHDHSVLLCQCINQPSTFWTLGRWFSPFLLFSLLYLASPLWTRIPACCFDNLHWTGYVAYVAVCTASHLYHQVLHFILRRLAFSVFILFFLLSCSCCFVHSGENPLLH